MITSKQFEQTKIGDLVKLEDVFFEDSGLSLDESNYLGLVVQRYDTDIDSALMTTPTLLEVLWPDGSLEELYEDEVCVLSAV